MTDQDRLMEISDVRAIVRRLVHGQPIPDGVVQCARETVQTMCQEAAGYGLTEADVLRGILHPLFERKRGCDCPACKARRAHAEDEQIERWGSDPSQQLGVWNPSPNMAS